MRQAWRIPMTAAAACVLSIAASAIAAQSVPYARSYPKTKAEVEAALQSIQSYAGQKLPAVEGFVGSANKPIDRYERAFYQYSIDVSPGGSGTIVRAVAKITAWYADPDPSKSGYETLASNGRLELDLLDRVGEKLGVTVNGHIGANSKSSITTPQPKLNLALAGIPSAPATMAATAESHDEVAGLRVRREAAERRMKELSDEIQSLQEIKKQQAHPGNLLVVKKNGTPVFARGAQEARVLFLAAAGDEFEFLDAASEWIHVQISGASRGYLRRSAVDMPESLAAKLEVSAPAATKVETFRVVREEPGAFPGAWEPLSGKQVKIVTVQPASQDPKQTGATAKLAFVAELLKAGIENATGGAVVAGVAIVFDSADGGIVGVTSEAAQQFAAGALSKDALWKACYFDPPDAFQPPQKP